MPGRDEAATAAAELGVPVVEGIGAPIKMAAMLVSLGLTQSRVRWQKEGGHRGEREGAGFSNLGVEGHAPLMNNYCTASDQPPKGFGSRQTRSKGKRQA